MELVYRRANPEDALELSKIHRRSWIFAHTSEEFNITEDDINKFLGTDDDLYERFKGHISSNDIYYVVEVDNLLSGYASGFGKDPQWQGNTYLDPSVVGQGIGTPLFTHVLEDLKGRGFFTLEIAVFNARSRRMAQGLGFEFVNEEKLFYIGSKSFPLVTMRKEL